jgi:signal peptidase I
VALAIAVVLRVVLFQPFTIPSSSMEPGLVTGDYIVVSKLSYGWSRASFPLNPPLFKGRFLGRTAQRGDVVVFRLPRDPSQTWIKRVIGLPGDQVRVRSGQVFINGTAIPQTPRGMTPTTTRRTAPSCRSASARRTAASTSPMTAGPANRATTPATMSCPRTSTS